jgi:hypothetical protein
MDETKEITIRTRNQFECDLDCPYLRRFDSSSKGTWWCNLYNSRLLFMKKEYLIHRHSRCNKTYLFTMKSSPNHEIEFEK